MHRTTTAGALVALVLTLTLTGCGCKSGSSCDDVALPSSTQAATQ